MKWKRMPRARAELVLSDCAMLIISGLLLLLIDYDVAPSRVSH